MEDYKFKFKKYPQLLEMYKIYRKMRLNATKWSMRESKDAGEKLVQVIQDQKTYSRTIFAKAIYEAFNSKKPKLYDTVDEHHIKWDELFGGKEFDDFTDLEKDYLVGLIAKNYVYELPKKFYNKHCLKELT